MTCDTNVSDLLMLCVDPFHLFKIKIYINKSVFSHMGLSEVENFTSHKKKSYFRIVCSPIHLSLQKLKQPRKPA